MTVLSGNVNKEKLLYENSLEKVMNLPMNKSSDDLPIAVKQFKWEQVNIGGTNKLQRQYEFQSSKSLTEFLSELLQYQQAINHQGIQVIQDSSVMVTVYTHDINDVTNRDLRYAKMSDQIYGQVSHVRR